MNAITNIRNFLAKHGVVVSEEERLQPFEEEQFRGLITSQFGVSNEVAATALQHLDILPESALAAVMGCEEIEQPQQKVAAPVVAPEVITPPAVVTPQPTATEAGAEGSDGGDQGDGEESDEEEDVEESSSTDDEQTEEKE